MSGSPHVRRAPDRTAHLTSGLTAWLTTHESRVKLKRQSFNRREMCGDEPNGSRLSDYSLTTFSSTAQYAYALTLRLHALMHSSYTTKDPIMDPIKARVVTSIVVEVALACPLHARMLVWQGALAMCACE